MQPRWITTKDEPAFLIESLSHMQRAIELGTADDGHCILGLSGGSTPGPVYEALGKMQGIPWNKVWLFLVDERYTDVTSPDSNQYLVRSRLTDYIDMDEHHLIFPDTTLPIDACVADYHDRLGGILTSFQPDLLILGLGEDGHTASLFPPVPKEAQGDTFAIHTKTNDFAIPDRISVSFRVLSAAKHSLFLLKGSKKKAIWDQMMASPQGIDRWPAKEPLAKSESTVVYCRQ